jgi:hypothetical protein
VILLIDEDVELMVLVILRSNRRFISFSFSYPVPLGLKKDFIVAQGRLVCEAAQC